ncbi:MAG: HNH endonuclease [Pseudomonadota bacterium]
MDALILKCDVSGRPLRWVSKEVGALLYCRDQVAWEAGDTTVRLHGGVSRMTGARSFMDVNTIIATRGVDAKLARLRAVPALTNTHLFRRDNNICMYCGESFATRDLTRDHVVPVSRGGKDVWENVVTACRPCNHRKGNWTPEEIDRVGMRLLAVPYAPNHAEALILGNRRILADQMAFLRSQCSRAPDRLAADRF